MKLQQNILRYAQFNHRDVVYFNGEPFKVYKPGWDLEMRRPDIHVAAIDANGRVNYLHFASLQVEVVEEPEPPAKEYRETNLYRDTDTGTIYYQAGENYIPLGTISASLTAPRATFKRLYREV